MAAQDLFSLKWNNYQENMSAGFRSLFDQDQLTDVTIYSGDSSWRAHRVVLCASSPYFEKMLGNRLTLWQHPVLILNDIHPSSLQSILEYIYSGKVTLENSKLEDFMRAGAILNIKGLSTSESPPIKSSYRKVAPAPKPMVRKVEQKQSSTERKRIIFTKEEKDVFVDVLVQDAEAQAYILNKGSIRAIEKGELYDRLTDEYNDRISRIPAVAHKVLSKRQFRKRCAEYLKKSEVEDALSDQESYDQQEMLRTGGGTTSKRKRPDDDPSGEQATFPPSALVSHEDEDGNDIFIYNDGHQKEEAFTGAGEETEDVDNSLCPTPESTEMVLVKVGPEEFQQSVVSD